MRNDYERIPVGADNAIHANELMPIFGLKSARSLRLRIHRMRRAGMIICSGNAGYYRPADPEEAIKFVRRMNNQALNTLQAVKAAQKLLTTKELGGKKNVRI